MSLAIGAALAAPAVLQALGLGGGGAQEYTKGQKRYYDAQADIAEIQTGAYERRAANDERFLNLGMEQVFGHLASVMGEQPRALHAPGIFTHTPPIQPPPMDLPPPIQPPPGDLPPPPALPLPDIRDEWDPGMESPIRSPSVNVPFPGFGNPSAGDAGWLEDLIPGLGDGESDDGLLDKAKDWLGNNGIADLAESLKYELQNIIRGAGNEVPYDPYKTGSYDFPDIPGTINFSREQEPGQPGSGSDYQSRLDLMGEQWWQAPSLGAEGKVGMTPEDVQRLMARGWAGQGLPGGLPPRDRPGASGQQRLGNHPLDPIMQALIDGPVSAVGRTGEDFWDWITGAKPPQFKGTPEEHRELWETRLDEAGRNRAAPTRTPRPGHRPDPSQFPPQLVEMLLQALPPGPERPHGTPSNSGVGRDRRAAAPSPIDALVAASRAAEGSAATGQFSGSRPSGDVVRKKIKRGEWIYDQENGNIVDKDGNLVWQLGAGRSYQSRNLIPG
jgi:hypothetical protein